MDNQESVPSRSVTFTKGIKEASSAIWKATSIPTRRRVKRQPSVAMQRYEGFYSDMQRENHNLWGIGN